MEIAVSRVDMSFSVDCSLENVPVPQYYPEVYMVRGTSLERWTSLENSQLATAVSSLVLQSITMVIAATMLYRPVHKFTQHMKSSMMGKKPAVRIESKFKANNSNASAGKDSTHGNDA
eukprot:TRINITY_DN12771_c0_g2_i2.p1 TRINITY_DN12771_c0_g2~~TRINITY_DN12771_c0_g2_i2.p1  ORF type:complete len:118 (+),score=18.34 TRINITY_DN12771_c0_g2_i2:231-584(+)